MRDHGVEVENNSKSVKDSVPPTASATNKEWVDTEKDKVLGMINAI